jgi:hypothetical protein
LVVWRRDECALIGGAARATGDVEGTAVAGSKPGDETTGQEEIALARRETREHEEQSARPATFTSICSAPC